MSENEEPLEEPLEEQHEEYVPEDDSVIGRAFVRSLAVFAMVAAVAAIVWLLGRGSEQAALETTIEVAAPEIVETVVTAPTVSFVDVTAESGIHFVHENGATGDKLLPETIGSGVAVLDHDGDGDADLLFVNSTTWPHREAGGERPTMALYENDGSGRFEDITAGSGLDTNFYGMGVAVGDVDADGRTDLFISAVGGNRLFRNEGKGHFRDVTASAGVAGDEREWSTSSGFFDYDGDGDLDLFVCNYVRWSKEVDFELDFRLTGVGRAYGPPQSYEGTFPYLYRNDGDWTFTDVSEAAGVRVENPATGLPMSKAMALGIVDIDEDGLVDVLVANDTVRNFLFHNQGDGTFEEAGEIFGVAYDRNGNATGAMGVDAGYLRNGPNLGFLIGNFANEMTSVYVAQDDPQFFVDEAIGEGIGAPSRQALSFGLFLFDYDLDGRLDVLAHNGHLEEEINAVDPSQTYRQAAHLFWNAGPDHEQGFIEIGDDSRGALAEPMVGRGSAYADFDGDGDLDVVLTQTAGPARLIRNDQQTGHRWLRVRLRGEAPNLDAVGAWVTVEAGGAVQRRQVMPTRSYLSQVERELTFGLGNSDAVDRLEVRWPDGTTENVKVDAVGQLVVVSRS